jgi:hypothetical protein
MGPCPLGLNMDTAAVTATTSWQIKNIHLMAVSFWDFINDVSLEMMLVFLPA